MLIARQPIFDTQKNVFGYEIFYREHNSNEYNYDDGNLASTRVIAATFFSMNLADFVGDKKVFIHFTEELLSNEIETLLPKDRLMIEMLEHETTPSVELICSCARLNNEGHKLVFDESVFNASWNKLFEMADIVKVNFLESTDEQIKKYIENRNDKVKLLAFKIEDIEMYEKAKKYGFDYFQGFFFEKPQLLEPKIIESNKFTVLKLFNVIFNKDIEFEEVAKVIEQDISFSYEILKLSNSVIFSRGNKVTSIREALVRLGINEIKKWGMISAMKKVSEKENEEVLNYSMVRARFMEQFACACGIEEKSMEFYTTGMISMLDVLMNTTMEKILDELELHDEIKDSLLNLNKNSELSKALSIIKNCEHGNWEEVEAVAKEKKISLSSIAVMHNESIKWTLDFQKNNKQVYLTE